MSYTPIFISRTEALYFNKEGVCASDLGLSPQHFEEAFDIVHGGIESIMIQMLNRPELTSTILADSDYVHMKNVCKQVAAMALGNWFVWLKHLKMNKVIIADQMVSMIMEVPIFSKEMKALLEPFRALSIGAVDPDETITYTWDDDV